MENNPIKRNPLAGFLAKLSAVSRQELPVVLCGLAALAVIAILVSIKFISVEFMLILTVLTIVKTSFEAGMVWQQMRRT